MRKKSLLDKVKFYLRIRWRAFKRYLLIFDSNTTSVKSFITEYV